MKVNLLRDIIVYYVRVNQDKEVNMSDYDKEVLTASALLERLDNIEAWLKQLEIGRNSICSNLVDIEDRLNELEEGRHGVD